MGLLESGDASLEKEFERVEDTGKLKEGYSRIYIAGEGIFRYSDSIEDQVDDFYRKRIGESDLDYMRGAASD